MIIKKHKNFEFGINRVKGEPFHFKPVYCAHNKNFFKVENGKDFKWINTWAHYVPTTIQCFWFWWCIYFKVFPKNIGGKTPQRYVEFRKTHLELLDLPHGSWRDQD